MKFSAISRTITALAIMIFAANSDAFESSAVNGVEKYIRSIVPDSTVSALGRSTALITVSRKGERFEAAEVTGFGETGLASELHRLIDWKKFPAERESRSTYFVALDGKGAVKVETVR